MNCLIKFYRFCLLFLLVLPCFSRVPDFRHKWLHVGLGSAAVIAIIVDYKLSNAKDLKEYAKGQMSPLFKGDRTRLSKLVGWITRFMVLSAVGAGLYGLKQLNSACLF